MDHRSTLREPEQAGAPPWRRPLVWLAAAALAAPLGIVLHEAAHFLTALAFGFERPALHFASSGYARSDAFWDALNAGAIQTASAVYPVAQAGTVAVAGVLATWILSAAAAFAAPRVGLRSFAGATLAAFALTAGARTLAGVIFLVSVRPQYPDATPDFDEFRASVALGIPVEVLVLAGIAITAACWWYVLPKVGRPRWVPVVALVAGFAGGVAAWMAAGPHVLP